MTPKLIINHESVTQRLEAIHAQMVQAVNECHARLTLLIEQEGALLSLDKIDECLPPRRLTMPTITRENFRRVK